MTHILFPFDFSAQCQQVAPFVSAMARRLDARVTLFSAAPPPLDAMPAALGEQLGEYSGDWRRALQARLDETVIPALEGLPTQRIADSGDPGYRIAEFAHNHGVDLVMMPTHGVGVFRSLLLGSTAAKVLHDARCPVWTAAHLENQHAQPELKTLLCAFDATDESKTLLRWAADFSRRIGASLKLLHVVNPISDWPTLERVRLLQEQVRRAAETQAISIQAAADVDAPLRIAVGNTAPTVAEQAREEDADLIVIGRGSLTASLGRLRTHSFGIIQRSPCPVLSV